MKTSKKYQVSIIIPTLNSAHTLQKCLQSIQNQTFKQNEILIIDGFSKDSTVDIAKENSTRILRTKGFQSEARNLGILNSSGDFVLFLDSDQILSDKVIEECVDKCLNGNIGMVKIPEVFVGESFWSKCSALWRNNYDKVEEEYSCRLRLIQGKPRFFIRKNLLDIGLLDNSLLWGEDYDLYIRLKNSGIKEESCKAIIYHNENLSLKKFFLKNLHYANSISNSKQKNPNQNFSLMLNHTTLTLLKIIRKPEKFTNFIGCNILLLVKSAAIVLGTLTKSN